ncbi:adenine-specific DNA-methyltransferase [Flavobacterium fontis]|uniref:site-specific DNA-methyltransferase (adenine-specific) n=1 Tax=Flavobacterium fontis TaxID=1124188 RepID=A0A1M5F0I9_9FLAO|nr:site-specific DNA-methyltransferase [Flavobacterium fontis]SHF84956.1 adenine-specific DNA-methyltransferase [Flavobacterium fontis]
MKLYKQLEDQLKKEPNYVTDNGELKKWVVLNKAHNFDEELIGLLLDNADLKEKFFVNVKGTLVFNQNLFVQFLEQKNYLNDSYTQFKKKVGLTIDGKYLKQRNEVALVWPFKDCILEGGQSREEDKKEEIFFNEILAQDEITQLLEPKVLTNAKRIDKDGEKPLDQFNRNENGTITDNLIIKGNNLLALHTLKEEFAGKVKLIYIDPPYNTGNDSFGYNDSFNRSTWLTFMRNRLYAAKALLSKDGMICVQCDDNENAYLKILMDEVFENRFLNNVAVKMSEASGVKMNHAKGRFPKLKEFILMYKMPNFKGFITVDKYEQKEWDPENNIFIDNLTEEQRSKLIELEAKEINDDTDVIKANEILKKAKKISLATKLKELDFENEDKKNEWLFKNSYRIIKTAGSSSLATLVKSLDNVPKQDIATAVSKKGVLFFYITDFNRDTKQPRLQVIFADSNIFKNPCDFWQDIKTTGAIAEEGGVKLSNGKKPEKILYRLIKMITNEGDVVLDYHLGSGTTTAVAHKMKRQFIGIEQLDYGENDSVNRLKNVINGDDTGISTYEDVNWKGGGLYVYLELKKYNQTFIERIEEANDTEVLLQIWEQMKTKSFLNYNVDIKKQDEHMEDFKALSLAEQKQHLCELLDKNQLYVNLSSLNDADFACTEEEKKVTKDFYQIKK